MMSNDNLLHNSPRQTVSRRALLGGSIVAAARLAGCRCQDGPLSDVTTTDKALTAYARRIDVHVHASPQATDRLLALMDEEGISKVVNLSGGAPGGSLEAQLTAARAAQGRIVVFTSPPWIEALQPGYGSRMASALDRAASLGAKGLKISKGLGLGARGPDGALLRIDDPELDPLFHAAGALKFPVMIHSGDPLAFWQPAAPSNERYAELAAHPGWSLYNRPVPSFDELYAQLETRVGRHPNTTFVSLHFGNCAEQPDRVAQSLRKHSNLFIDTAARIPELGRHPPDQMRAFFDEFQDRVLFGSDLGIGPLPEPLFLGSSGDTAPTAKEYRRFFDATRKYFETTERDMLHPTPIQGNWLINGIGLSSNQLDKLYVSNAQRVLGI